ncbi:zf-HC2 domain-containing protein [Kitasatospora sp. NPDC051853]|uniref:zf-HC2 domain-containing protein n=1 Tax=Kitasatospora sp. NPDC051853 TaxID=3364058 RepID=UPI0037AC0224
MSSAGSTGRSRRGSVRAALGRRAEPLTELHPVPAAAPAPGQHHLGDRLAAFVDGELDHDDRERVQSHLATCADCLAEADESRAAKQLLTRTAVPEPSGLLMARLLAVAALPDDEDLPGGPGQPLAGLPASGPLPEPGPSTFGGSRLTGGSFGRGAGASFGGGALGAGSPLPGLDPRARRSAAVRPLAAAVRPLAALAELPPVVRASAPRGRRFVFAAAGAFSVAAVTLGGVGAVSGQPVPTRISPVSGSGSGGAAVVPVDFQGERAVQPARGARPTASPSGRPDGSPSGPQHYFR